MGMVRRRTRRRTMLMAGGMAYAAGRRSAGDPSYEGEPQQEVPPAPPPPAPTSGGSDTDELQRLADMHAAGALNLNQALIMAPTRPPEELYDLHADPFELHNLAAVPDHAARLAGLRSTLDEWMQTSGDLGRQPEPAARRKHVGLPQNGRVRPGMLQRHHHEAGGRHLLQDVGRALA